LIPGVIEAYKCFFENIVPSLAIITVTHLSLMIPRIIPLRRWYSQVDEKENIGSGGFKCIDDAVAISEEERLAHRDE